MDQKFLKEVGRYLYPFYANYGYHNEYYYNELVKKYGKKEVLDAIKYIQENGSPFSFFA